MLCNSEISEIIKKLETSQYEVRKDSIAFNLKNDKLIYLIVYDALNKNSFEMLQLIRNGNSGIAFYYRDPLSTKLVYSSHSSNVTEYPNLDADYDEKFNYSIQCTGSYHPESELQELQVIFNKASEIYKKEFKIDETIDLDELKLLSGI